MKKILYKTLSVFGLFIFTVIQGQVLVATGTGYGLTKDAATEQAKRDAVEQGLGAYMTSTTTVTATSIEEIFTQKPRGLLNHSKLPKKAKAPTEIGKLPSKQKSPT